MARVIYEDKAISDLLGIAAYKMKDDRTAGILFMGKLEAEIQKLANTPFLKGQSIENAPVRFRKTTILKGAYTLYFIRIKYGIEVQRVHNSRMRPLTPFEITAGNGN